MIVYRIIKYEGSAADIAAMYERSIDGEYQTAGLLITAAPVEPRIVESTPMLLHVLDLRKGKQWVPPTTVPPPAAQRRSPSPLAMSHHTSDADALVFVRRIEYLLDNGFGWAADTLDGIRETVLSTGRVTDGQRRAVDNIENARRDR